VARRISKYYRKESTVIHPPVDTENFTVRESDTDEKYFLMVGRLIAYKRHSIAIRAFNEMKLPLKIIGRGPELKRLQKIAGPTIEFLSRVEDEQLKRYYANCKAVIFPQEEDFGIVAIEALSCGKPLIAFRGGDIPEHMEEDKMGVFFNEQTSGCVIEAVKKFNGLLFDEDYIRSKVIKFGRENFKIKMRNFIEDAVAKHKNIHK
jgi:glycosyltransferase involved in cell wall biosynthesis